MSNAGKNFTLLASVLLVSLLLCEVAFRLINGVSPFALTNVREARVIKVDLNKAVRYDSRVGWVHLDNLDFGALRTAEYGIRRHSPEQTRVRKGAILVSGSSFTAGSGVVDTDTWPAQMEQLLGRPVENAAAGGWGVDQVIMRAEDLLPVVEPEAIVIDLMDTTIQWASYSVFSMPKPYFTFAQGKLTEHNVPVPQFLPSDGLPRVGWLKSLGSYSLIVDRVMATIDANAWYGEAESIVQIQNDPINVTCALLQRLKLKAELKKIRVALVSLFAGGQVTAKAPPQSVLRVENCARSMGIQVISVFDRMRALYREDPHILEALYGKHGDLLSHYTPRGNREVAMVVAEGLRLQPPEGMAADYRLPAPSIPGDGRNLLDGSETLVALVSGTMEALSRQLAKPTPGKAQEFQISASGAKGEHVVTLRPVKIEDGPVTLSLEVRPQGSEMFRVQLLANGSSGVIGDFDLRRARTATVAVGELEVRDLEAQVVPLRDGWHRVSVGGTLPAAQLHIVLQLKDPAGATTFAPNGEAILFRRLQLERGQSASPYTPTSGRASVGFTNGDGINLVQNSEGLKQLALVQVSFDPLVGTPTRRVFRLTATGENREHYASLRGLPTTTGPHTASVQVRKMPGVGFRLQLLDDRANGVIGDFNLETRAVSLSRMGTSSKIDADIDEAEDGWMSISVTGTLDGPSQVILQLLDREGKTAFAPAGEALEISAVQVERGQTASPYMPTSGPGSPGFIGGDGINLVENSERLKQVGLADSSLEAVVGATTPRVYRLAATGSNGEHYASITGVPTAAGPYTASVQVRKAPGAGFRLQLLDTRAASGAIGDFNLETRSISLTGIGTARKIDANIDEAKDGWMAISVTGTLDGPSQVILQLLDPEGRTAFAPGGESLEIRGVQVERGQTASPYVPTSGPASPGFIAGDGINLVKNSEGIKQIGLSGSSFDAAGDTTRGLRVYRLTATGKEGGHYASLVDVPTITGPYTASVRVRLSSDVGFRLQLLDDAANGVIGDFNLETRSIFLIGVGASRKIDANIDEAGDGWLNVSVTGTLDGPGHVILQLLDRQGRTDFAPAGETLEMHGLQVERGQSASPYAPTSGPASPGFIKADGINLVQNSEDLKQVGVAESSFDAVGDPATGPRAYRLIATGKNGEHFASVTGLPTTTGPYTASVQVKRASGVGFRLQLLDDRTNGVIGDFNLETHSVSLMGIGTSSKIDADINEAPDGWVKTWVTGTLDGSGHIILQLLDWRGNTVFPPAGEALDVSGIQVERGQSASPYRPSSGQPNDAVSLQPPPG
jgi:hypothetical protein